MKEKIKKLLEHINELTSVDRLMIRQLYDESDMGMQLNEHCPDCWRDAVIELAVKHGVSLGKRRFVGPVARWMPHGIVMDAATDEATIERFCEEFPNQKIYESNI